MDVFVMDLFHPPTAPRSRGRNADASSLWQPTAASSWTQNMSVWRPHSAVTRSDDGATHIRFETPGFPRDRLHIELSDDRSHLTVSGTARTKTGPANGDGDASAKDGAGDGKARGPWASVDERQFTQTYRLPRDADVEGIKADYEHGVLAITVPAKHADMLPQKRTIAIRDKEDAKVAKQ
uniref:Small heat-shock protein n=1 Tax=Pyropia yezoensis TaxID=2788 RepID=A0A809QY81_PYRYE|nr:small heat shock protein [Neopyropia yezoensis]BBJ35515.1 small heat-shock protein [Neopyropia yezoensis]|eukprot:contig_9957_g2378